MKKKTIETFKEELLKLTVRDLRDKDLTGRLEEVRLILLDIFTIFKAKGKPVVINTS